eukprot:2860026-Rhodomonas_salina.1
MRFPDLAPEEQQVAEELGYSHQLWDAEDKTLGKEECSKTQKKKRKNHYPAFDGPCWENSYTGY